MAWLRLIRWKNLVIIYLTQLLVWACVMLPMWQYTESPMLLNGFNFSLLTISTILIAAAGYIINDYFDIKIDVINKPEKVVLERSISLKTAIVSHTTLNVAGIVLAAIVAKQVHHYEWLLLQFVCTALLWFYSTHFKRRFVIGNFVVAILTAFTIIVFMLYEPAIHYYWFRTGFVKVMNGYAPNPVWVLGIYTYFAFMLTWMREVVKDMEDFKGDAEEGCITMPIKWGLKRSIRFTQVLGLLVIIPLLFGAVKLFKASWWLLGVYTIVVLVVPIAIWLVFLQREATKAHYHKASNGIKLIMVLGISSLIIYYFQVHV